MRDGDDLTVRSCLKVTRRLNLLLSASETRREKKGKMELRVLGKIPSQVKGQCHYQQAYQFLTKQKYGTKEGTRFWLNDSRNIAQAVLICLKNFLNSTFDLIKSLRMTKI